MDAVDSTSLSRCHVRAGRRPVEFLTNHEMSRSGVLPSNEELYYDSDPDAQDFRQ